MKDKRSSPRIAPFVAPCVVLDGARPLTGYVTEIGMRGGRITTEDPPPTQGAPVVLELKISRRVARCKVLATVKWVKPEGEGSHAFGLSFEGMGSTEKAALAGVIDEFRRCADALETRRGDGEE